MRLFLVLYFSLFSLLLLSQEKKEKKPTPRWKIHGRFAFIFNQSSFINWAAGGDNTVSWNINVNYDFNYKKNNINWDTRFITSYGLSYISDKGYRKTDDRFELNTILGVKTSTYWFFSFIGNFRSQFNDGYNYKKDPRELVSQFFSPAYLTLGPGMLWKKSDDLSLNIAPATARWTLVNDLFSGKYGVEQGRNTAFALGFNLSGYFKFVLMENIEMENILNLYSDYLAQVGNIDVDYQANIRFKVNRNIKMHMTFHTIVDDNSSSKIQFRQLFGLGVNYSFHEKVRY